MSVCSILLLTGGGTWVTSLEEMIKGGELGMDKKFASLSEVVFEKTLNAVTDMGFTDMIEIQHKSDHCLMESVCTCTVWYIYLLRNLTYAVCACVSMCECGYVRVCACVHAVLLSMT